MSQAVLASTALDRVMRDDRGRCLAALIARFRDFQLAEDALQDALAAAVQHWGRGGVPDRPQGWLLAVARRKVIDRLRRGKRDGAGVAALAVLAADPVEEEAEMIPDHRLRLIFTCCHPALEPKTRVALTLRTLGGLTTAQIARAFLDTEPAMGQRLSRAKAKIAAAGIPFKLPESGDLPERLNSVLTVVYLIFNADYTAGPGLDRDLCDEAIFLARLLDQLQPATAEVEGALALLLLTHARRAARVVDGVSVALAEQDRSLWDQPMRSEGQEILDRAVARRSPGPFQIKAAIAALHSQNAPDWPQITALYAGLLCHEPTAVVRLNHAVALAETGGLREAIDRLEALSEALSGYQPFHAARAELLARSGQTGPALEAYGKAIALASSPADAAFLARRRNRQLS
ncbi:RNA polymerase sigma factor [Tabrizicola sp.]|uniref:RNA polymerase sigma factor n=1 Tax=Tabrizicola sp. TaxID=2005166 RepID=UPI0035B1C219